MRTWSGSTLPNFANRFDERQSGMYCTLSVVLMSLRMAKVHEHSVAHVLRHEAIEPSTMSRHSSASSFAAIPVEIHEIAGIRSRQNNDAGAHRHPPAKVLDVLIGQTNAAGGHEAADGAALPAVLSSVLTLRLSVAVLSRRHPGHDPFERLDLEALAVDVLLIKDPGHFSINSGLLYVVATAVVGDLEDFVGEVFRLTLACEGIRAAKFLIAGEPAEYRALAGILGSAQMALRLSPFMRRSQIASAILSLYADGRPRLGWSSFCMVAVFPLRPSHSRGVWFSSRIDHRAIAPPNAQCPGHRCSGCS